MDLTQKQIRRTALRNNPSIQKTLRELLSRIIPQIEEMRMEGYIHYG